MKQGELRKPLIQSAIVLLVVIFLISLVAGSEAHGFIGGITSIFKGIFLTILYGIALTVAIIFSIAVLFAVFFGAVALYSPDKSKEMFFKFRQNLSDLITTWTKCCKEDSSCSSKQVCETAHVEIPEPQNNMTDKQPIDEKEKDIKQDEHEVIRKEFTNKIADISVAIKLNQEQNTALSSSLDELREIITTHANNLEAQQDGTASSVTSITNKLDNLESTFSKQVQAGNNLGERIDNLQKNLTALTDDLQQLKKVKEDPIEKKIADSATPQAEHRIFSYFEKDKDKAQLASLITEAVTKSMTYAEIDTFLSKSLPKKSDSIIKKHPSLLKTYIQDCKKLKK